VLTEILDRLASLLSPAEKATIMEVLDLSLIKQQTEAGLYSRQDWITQFASIVNVITIVSRQVQSESRQALTASGWQELEIALKSAEESAWPTLLCRCLEFLLGRVDAIRVDSGIARLLWLAPAIRINDHGAEDKLEKFNRKLSRGLLALEYTTAPALVSAHAAALMDSIVGDSANISNLKQASWPESLQLGEGYECWQDGSNISCRSRPGGGGGKEPDDGVPRNRGGEGWYACSICTDPLGAAAALRCWGCRQVMGHQECVVVWLACYSNTCPLCRTPDPLCARQENWGLGDGRLDPGTPAGDPGDGPFLQPGGSAGWSEVQLDDALSRTRVAIQWERGAMAFTAAAGNGSRAE
jgi:hypothetical protein